MSQFADDGLMESVGTGGDGNTTGACCIDNKATIEGDVYGNGANCAYRKKQE
jgi:hypothetical protein